MEKILITPTAFLFYLNLVERVGCTKDKVLRKCGLDRLLCLREWSLIMGRGGYKWGGRGGGQVKFYPYKNGGGAEKVAAMLKGGYKRF